MKNQMFINSKKQAYLSMLSILAVIFFTGCGQIKQSETPKPQKPAAALIINGEEIAAGDFERRLFKARFVRAAQGEDYDGAAREEAYSNLKDHTIQQLIKETIVIQEAAKAGVSVPEAQVEQVLANIKSRFPTEEAFKTTMQSRGLDETTIKAYNRLQMTSVALMQKIGGQAQYDEFINNQINSAKVEFNRVLVDEMLKKLSLSTADPLQKSDKL